MKNSPFRFLAVAVLAAALLGCQSAPPPAPGYGARRLPDQPFNPSLPDAVHFAHDLSGPGWVDVVYRVVPMERRLVVCGVWIAHGDKGAQGAAARTLRQARLEVEDVPVASLVAFEGYWEGALPPAGLTAGCVEAENPVPAPWTPAYTQIDLGLEKKAGPGV